MMHQNTKLFTILATIAIIVIIIVLLYVFKDTIFGSSPDSVTKKMGAKDKDKSAEAGTKSSTG